MSEASPVEEPGEESLNQVLEQLESASKEVAEANLLSSHIANNQSLDPAAARPFVFAFGFTLHLSSDSVEDPADYPFGASITGYTEDGDRFRFPPPFSETTQSSVDAWTFAFESDPGPMVKARLGDLLWEMKAGERPDRYARGAISALLENADDSARHAVHRSFDLTRALQLSLAIRDPDIQNASSKRCCGFSTKRHRFRSPRDRR